MTSYSQKCESHDLRREDEKNSQYSCARLWVQILSKQRNMSLKKEIGTYESWTLNKVAEKRNIAELRPKPDSVRFDASRRAIASTDNYLPTLPFFPQSRKASHTPLIDVHGPAEAIRVDI